MCLRRSANADRNENREDHGDAYRYRSAGKLGQQSSSKQSDKAIAEGIDTNKAGHPDKERVGLQLCTQDAINVAAVDHRKVAICAIQVLCK